MLGDKKEEALELSWAVTAGKRQVERKVMLFPSSFETVDNISWVTCVEGKSFYFYLRTNCIMSFMGSFHFLAWYLSWPFGFGERELSCPHGMRERSLSWMRIEQDICNIGASEVERREKDVYVCLVMEREPYWKARQILQRWWSDGGATEILFSAHLCYIVYNQLTYSADITLNF